MGSDPLADATRFEKPRRFIPGIRSSAYAVVFFIVFALSAAEIGFTSYLFQKFGNDQVAYPNAQTKYALGANLFAGIWSLLWVLGGFFLPMIPLIFAIFASSATFLGVGAVFANNKAGSACGSAEAFQPPQFQDDCRIYESVMALAFALFGICLFLTIAYVYEAFIAKNKKKTAFGA